jgi:acetyl-CoA acetyltransferase
VETFVGRLTVARPYLYFEGCRQGFYPLDQALCLSAHAKRYDIQQAASALAIEMPYREAAAWMGQWTEGQISDEVLHGMVQQVGVPLTLLDICPTPGPGASRDRPGGGGEEVAADYGDRH